MFDDDLPSIKLLDTKRWVRVDPATGLPQLIRVEPATTEDGTLIPDKVMLYIDNQVSVQTRGEASRLIRTMNCAPYEAVQPKQGVNS
jgi:hypothetical protein